MEIIARRNKMAEIRPIDNAFGFMSCTLIIGYNPNEWKATATSQLAFNPLSLIAIREFAPNPNWSEILLPGRCGWLLVEKRLGEMTEVITSLLPDDRRWGGG